LSLAWKTAGWIGLDRWLLPLLGMPWRGGALFGKRPARGSEHRIGRQS
jgi:thiosulfate dehydrogenase (quinone) large subunit